MQLAKEDSNEVSRMRDTRLEDGIFPNTLIRGHRRPSGGSVGKSGRASSSHNPSIVARNNSRTQQAMETKEDTPATSASYPVPTYSEISPPPGPFPTPPLLYGSSPSLPGIAVSYPRIPLNV